MTISLMLHSQASKDGTRPIVFVVRQFKTKTTISTKCSCLAEDFVGEFDINSGRMVAVRRKCKGSAIINAQIDAMYTNIKSTQAELTAAGELPKITASEFRDIIVGSRIKPTQSHDKFVDVYKEHVSSVNTDKTRETYVYALQKLTDYVGMCRIDSLRFSDIDVPFLNRFDLHLTKNGISVGGRRIILCNIRAVFNYAMKCGYVSRDLYPFGVSGFVVKKGAVAKEEPPMEVIRDIFNYKAVPGSMREVAIDVFKFSLFACGINPIDIYQNIHIEDGHAVFVRQKTRTLNPNRVRLAITPEMNKIIEKYKGDGKRHLFNFHERIHTYMSWYCKIRQELYRVGKEIGFEGLKFYHARYAWSTYASSNEIKADTICIEKSLGHIPQGMAAMHYIVYDWRNTWEAQEKVEMYILDMIE